MKQIVIFGAGGLGKEVAMLLEQINQASAEWDLLGFFDDEKAKGSLVNGYTVLGGIQELNRHSGRLNVVIAIGSPKVRAEVRSKIEKTDADFPALIHPAALLGKPSQIGQGSIITAGCILTVNIRIGDFVLINLASTIGHDADLGDFVSVMPGANLSGNVKVKDYAFIGTGAQILNNLEIGHSSVIGAGAVVTKSVPANTVAVGVPAKAVKNTK